MNKYIGHTSQISGVEEVILDKGKGKGMTLLEIRNGKGLRITLTPDRCMDIARVEFKGDNVGYFAPSGYVAPEYYDNVGAGFLKSFYAGFMTTCGLTAVGSPCTDNGEELPLHGNISNTPCENYWYTEDDEVITVNGVIRDAAIFGHSYILNREYKIYKNKNEVELCDTVENIGNTKAPCMLLYHTNFGYPMLTENSRVFIPENSSTSRNPHAEESYASRLAMEKPQKGYEECCYYYDVKSTDDIASVGIFNPDIEKGVKISYDKKALGYFVEWKMMGENEYVLGLEPGNCTPDGRAVMREKGILADLEKGEKYNTNLRFEFSENMEEVQCL